jgi:hypothetical protein
MTLQVIKINVMTVGDHLEIHMIVGLQIPQPNGQPGILPLGVIRVPLAREPSVEVGQELTEQGEALPEEKKDSGIVLPDDATVAKVNAVKDQPHGTE